MTTPISYDVRGGIRCPPMFDNNVDGDCVVASYSDNLLTKNVTNLSTWKKILYRAGFRPPTNATARDDYTAYLATLGEKPGPGVGVVPSGFFTWLQDQGKIKNWGTIDYTNPELVEQGMIDHRGVILTMALTPWADGAGDYQMALWDVNAAHGHQPDPNLEHAVCLVEYNVTTYAIFTWGLTVRMTPAYFAACVNGCWWFE